MRTRRRILQLICKTDSNNESVIFRDGRIRNFTDIRMKTTQPTSTKHNEKSWESLVQKWRGYIKTQDEN